ncbi:MAG TPA: hypothetical protein PLC34_15945 [Burkholderiaceae bacterium]|jgi:hypothetical protein|nr:hypothetical protein [Burkholderiaceae bacterium]
MNLSTPPSTATTDADRNATIALPAPTIARNLPVANETSAPINPDERPLAGVVAALNDHERLEVEKRRRAVQEELVARQRFD